MVLKRRVPLFQNNLDVSLARTVHTFCGAVPVCAAISFFKSPTVSSGLHLTRTLREQEAQCIQTLTAQTVIRNNFDHRHRV